ncbi:ASKHA domain-containing protein [Fenollaria sporofastidiosus]|uniref:ASKHA domain-containing protein n=1 Tax=Fenollaria sporofastidiosus TaxID=2811778 RepID=UPI001C000864|nr:ASKHA domain-containing protein [Fenollaria sporofastidiosus]
MPKIHILSDDNIIEAKEESVLLDVLRENGYFIEAPCNGMGTCKKCKVRIIDGTHEDVVLSCQYKLKSDISLDFFDEAKAENLLTSDIDTFDATESVLTMKTHSFEDSRDADTSWEDEYEKVFGHISYNVLKNTNFTKGVKHAIYLNDDVIAIRDEGNDKIYAAAVDIGTTSVAISVLDISSAKVVERASFVNPQISFGLDVLSRMSAAIDLKDNLYKMQEQITKAIEENIIKIFNKHSLDIDSLYEVVFSANSVMMHILMGVDPTSLGEAPYKIVSYFNFEIDAKDIGMKFGRYTKAFTIPSISSYVGADILSGVNHIDIESIDKNVMFMDIGTNTELVLKYKDHYYASSCAAGPALEGMNIEFGSRAELGAIENVFFDLDSGSKNIVVIGKQRAKSICGSGVLAVIREALKVGLIDYRGRLVKLEDLDENDKRRTFLKDLDGKSVIDLGDVYITKKDIRNIQLSKSAILSGIVLLFKKLGMRAEEVDDLFIAGQFGYHLSKDMLLNTYFIPKIDEEKISYLKNTSLDGAISVVLSKKKRKNLLSLSKKIKFLELSYDDNYQKAFIDCSYFK